MIVHFRKVGLTQLQRRTANFLTVIGIILALVGICYVALPFLGVGLAKSGCESACKRDLHVLYNQAHYVYVVTGFIFILGILIGFLPRAVSGI